VSNDRSVPDFTLALGGQPAPAALRASVTAVSATASLNAASRVEVALANQSLRWLDHPLLALGGPLELSLGYRPEPLPRLFSGEIVSHSAGFPSSGVPTLDVAAQDRMAGLQAGTKARWFAIPVPTVGNLPLPDMAVGGIVSLEHGLVPIFDPVGAALSVVLGGAEAVTALDDTGAMQRLIRKQRGESDFAFLRRISAENGWDMLIDHDGPLGGRQLRFMSPADRLSPDLTLAYGRSLVDFTPRVSEVGQIVSVTAFVWVARIKTRFAVRIGWDWDRAQLTIDISTSLIPLGKGASHVLIDEPVTPASAPRRIVSELIPRLNQRLTGSGSTVGDPRIRAGSVVKLEGLGVEFSGLYRVTSATHQLDAGGYRTRFDVRKDVWFGSVPLPAQGAIPIRVQVA
jgi:hypothetical protein